MNDPATRELAPFLGPRPGRTYVYGRFDEGTREPGCQTVVCGLGADESGALHIRESVTIPSSGHATGTVESSRESRIRIEGNEILKATPEGDVVLLRAPLRVGTAWTQHVVEYTPQAGWRRHELRCRIAMIETVPVFGRDRLTIRIVGRAMLPLGEVVVTEQHATDIGLVLRRERMGDLGASEIVLEEIRGALDRRADR